MQDLFAGKIYGEEANFAAGVVSMAAKLCREIQGEMVTGTLEKSDRSPVTVADFASQAIVARLLKDTYPQDPLIAEEASQTLRALEGAKMLDAVTAYVARIHEGAVPDDVCLWIDHGGGKTTGRFWTLDPIDGTKGFLRGDQYVTALALIDGGQVVVGALGCPNLNRKIEPEIGGEGVVVVAVRSQGCWALSMDGESLGKLSVSMISDPGQARVLRSFESGHTDSGKLEQIIDRLHTAHRPVLMDSQAKYALMAAGKGDLLFRLLSPEQPGYVEKIWDQAAGSIIVEEAGGKVTDLRGTPLDFSHGRGLIENIGVLASNGCLHDDALGILRSLDADRRLEGV
ncbi:MAG: 3'(2'),5'-bisphosphate nucleotidase [Anaerolineales bacterium]